MLEFCGDFNFSTFIFYVVFYKASLCPDRKRNKVAAALGSHPAVRAGLGVLGLEDPGIKSGGAGFLGFSGWPVACGDGVGSVFARAVEGP